MRKIFPRPTRYYTRFAISIHAAPDSNSERIDLLKMGTFVWIESIEDGWGKLSGRPGFVKMDYITIA